MERAPFGTVVDIYRAIPQLPAIDIVTELRELYPDLRSFTYPSSLLHPVTVIDQLSIFIIACTYGKERLARRLLSENQKFTKTLDVLVEDLWSQDNISGVKTVIELGADVNVILRPTYLINTFYTGKWDKVRFLIKSYPTELLDLLKYAGPVWLTANTKVGPDILLQLMTPETVHYDAIKSLFLSIMLNPPSDERYNDLAILEIFEEITSKLRECGGNIRDYITSSDSGVNKMSNIMCLIYFKKNGVQISHALIDAAHRGIQAGRIILEEAANSLIKSNTFIPKVGNLLLTYCITEDICDDFSIVETLIHNGYKLDLENIDRLSFNKKLAPDLLTKLINLDIAYNIIPQRDNVLSKIHNRYQLMHGSHDHTRFAVYLVTSDSNKVPLDKYMSFKYLIKNYRDRL